jgi:predicted ATPase/class 3 adenylate cyclase
MAASGVVTFLFTDIEGSSRLWERDPERMRPAMTRHDALAEDVVQRHHGVLVDTAGDGIYAVFDDPLDALQASVQLQRALPEIEAATGISLSARCGLHAGIDESRSGEFVGREVSRAARIMAAAHGGQILLSQAVALLLRNRMPAEIALRDLGTVRLRDLAQSERLYQVAHPDLRRDFPALRNVEATPNNLPQQLTSFVGRERDLANLATILPRCRLLTLTGAGGIGKTRLSLQAAGPLLNDFPDGVWFIELAPIADAQLVAQTIASTLGVKGSATQSVEDALAEHVRDRRLLAILDNCEHVVHACAEIAARLLQAGPHVTILATSREPLRVTGETTYPVQPLDVPDRNGAPSPASLTSCEATRLFIDRATGSRADFRLTDRNAGAVADICRRLDGIPLALELAAARVRSMSVEIIAEHLDDRFRLLVQGDRTALPRQQTLRALIEWSYDLLTEHERALFRRLAVFAASFTLEAAETIGADVETSRIDVLSVLPSLVDKSLVTLDLEEGRYRLLESIRQYAQNRLVEAGEESAIRDGHLAYYVALTEEAFSQLSGPRQAEWLARLDSERENIVAAHGWCDHTSCGAGQGLRLAHSVKPYWLNRGLIAFAHRFAVEALGRTPPHDCTGERARGLFDAGQICSYMGRYAEACDYLQESLAIARQLGDEKRIAAVLQPLGFAELCQGNLEEADHYLAEAVSLARGHGNRRELAAALNMRATLHRMEGDWASAESLYQEVIALARDLGDQDSVAVGMLNLAIAAIGRGDAAQARRLLVDAHAVAKRMGSKWVGQSLFEISSGLAATLGEWPVAARLFGVAEAQAAQTGLHRDAADEAFLRPLVERARTALGTQGFAAAEMAGRALAYDAALGEVRAWLGA